MLADLCVILAHICGDTGQPCLLGKEHRSTTRLRKAITVNEDHIEIAEALCDSFFDDLIACIDQLPEAPLEDLFVGALAPRDSFLMR